MLKKYWRRHIITFQYDAIIDLLIGLIDLFIFHRLSLIENSYLIPHWKFPNSFVIKISIQINDPYFISGLWWENFECINKYYYDNIFHHALKSDLIKSTYDELFLNYSISSISTLLYTINSLVSFLK